MIVVLGSVAYRPTPGGRGSVVGLAGDIAIAAVAEGASVELLAKVGEDAAGEELLLAVARGGVGHLAVLRDPGRPTALVPAADDGSPDDEDDGVAVGELLASVSVDLPAPDGSRPTAGPGLGLEPADLSLGLRYLREYRVVVALEPLAEGCAAVLVDAASFTGAALVVIAVPGVVPPAAYAQATILEAPAEDPDGAFTVLIGRFVAALDRGEPVPDALRGAVAAGGWEVAEP